MKENLSVLMLLSYKLTTKAKAERNFFPSDHDHERILDHILEGRYDCDLISDHFLGGTDRKKIRSLEFLTNYCINPKTFLHFPENISDRIEILFKSLVLWLIL